MEAQQFDCLTRLLGRTSARRPLLGALVLSPLAGPVARAADDVEAKKKRKKKRKPKKPKPNAFGCLEVGQACNGDSTQCCSGICEGSKPKKGKKDSSRCIAHDTASCQAGAREPHCGGDELVLCTTSTGYAGQCNSTTGNAGYCLASSACFPCATDADCQQVCGARGACLQCTDCVSSGGTMCGSPDDLGCSAM